MKLLKTYHAVFVGLHKNVWLISFVLLVNRMGSMVLLFAPLYYTSTLHFTKAEAGFIMSFYGAGSIVGSYVGGWLADRYNQKHIMVLSMFVSAIVLVSILVTENKYLLCAILFLYALTADVFRPASSVAITNNSDEHTRTRSISLMRMAINLGFTIGPAIGGVIAYNIGYKFLFIIDALTTVAAGIILLVYFPSVNYNKRTQSVRPQLDVKTSAYKDVHFLKFIVLVSLYGICFFQLLASIPTYFKEVCHYNEDTIGYLMAFNGLLVVVVEMPLVAYLERHKKTALYILIGCVQIAVALLFLGVGKGSIIMAVMYIIFITLSEMFAMPFMMNYTLNRAHGERQGQYSALYSIGYGISFIIAPAIGMYVAQHYGFSAMFALFICLSVLAASGFYVIVGNSEKNNNTI